MAKTIDLSVLGGDFNKLNRALRGNSHYVFETIDTRGNGCIEVTLRELKNRSEPLIWVEGELPPVGCRCLYSPLGSGLGVEVEIVAHFQADVAKVAAYVPVTGARVVNQARAEHFRAFPTAAETRDSKTEAMYHSIYFASSLGIWGSLPEVTRETFRMAIDAGWTKVEQP